MRQGIAVIIAGACLAAGCGKTAPPPAHPASTAAPVDVLVVGTDEALDSLSDEGLRVRRVTPEAEDEGALREELAAARRLYRDLEFEQSLAAIGELQQRLQSRATSAEDYDLLHLALVHRGMNELALGREDRAQAAFRAAVALRPETELPGAEYPPDSRQAYDQVRAELRAEPPVSVALTTDPPGAEVQLDGRPAGVTPLTVSAVPGRHYLRIVALGREPRALPVDLGESTAPLSVALPPARAALLVEQLASVEPDGLAALSPEARDTLARQLDVSHLMRIDVNPEGATGALIDLGSGSVRRATAAGEPTEAVLEVARGLRAAAMESAAPTENPPEPHERTVWGSPWLWIGVGAVLAGAAVTTGLLVGRNPDQVIRVESAP